MKLDLKSPQSTDAFPSNRNCGLDSGHDLLDAYGKRATIIVCRIRPVDTYLRLS